MRIEFELPSSAVKAILLFAGKKDRRGYFNGILLEVSKEGMFLVATDGAHLGAYRLRDKGPEDYEGKWPLPSELFANLGKQPFVKVLIDDSAKEFSAECCGAIVRGRAKFYPDWRLAIPKTVSGEPGQYSPDLTAHFSKAAKLLFSKASPYPVIGYNGPQLPALVHIGLPAFIGVVCPFRHDGPLPTAPEWA